MASISSAWTSTSLLPRAAIVRNASAALPSAIIGLPSMRRTEAGKVRCSIGGGKDRAVESSESKLGVVASSLMAVAAAAMCSSPAAVALVDERMSTEGTGLPFGLSNNLLGWLLLVVFALIWALYFTYTATLDEDEDSGLSL